MLSYRVIMLVIMNHKCLTRYKLLGKLFATLKTLKSVASQCHGYYRRMINVFRMSFELLGHRVY